MTLNNGNSPRIIALWVFFPLILSGQPKWEFVHGNQVNSVSFSPNGNFLATGSNDGKARVFNLLTGKEVQSFPHNRWVKTVSFSRPDGQYLKIAGDEKSRILNLVSGKEVKNFQFNEGVTTYSFSLEGNFLATGTAKGIARVFDLTTEKEVKYFLFNSAINSVAISPNGFFLATGSDDRQACIFNFVTGKIVKSFVHNSLVYAVSFSPDGNFLATGSEMTIWLFNIKTGELVKSFENISSINSSISFSPDGNFLAIGSKKVKVLNLLTGMEVISFENDGYVNSISFSSDGKFLATGNSDNIARVFDLDPFDFISLEKEQNKKLTQIKIDLISLENERNEKLKQIESPEKDEFETQAEFEKRKIGSKEKINSLLKEYNLKIEQAKKLYEIKKKEIQFEFNKKLTESNAKIESQFVLGIYNPEKNIFPITISNTNQPFEIKIPREIARDFKTQAPSLLAKGQKQLNADLMWEYFNWSITTPDGQSFTFGEQRGINSQLVSQPNSTEPPALNAKVTFTEPSGNTALDAEEKGKLTFTVTNTGKGSAFGVEGKLTSTPVVGITSSSSLFIGEIPADQSKSSVFELNASSELKDGKSQFTFTFNEARGFPPDPIKVTIDTHAFIPPILIIADVGVKEPNGNGRIDSEEIVEVTDLKKL